VEGASTSAGEVLRSFLLSGCAVESEGGTVSTGILSAHIEEENKC
jgi:hypothetical protein